MYGQVVVGPPGSGKSTYCRGMRQFLRGIGRNAVIINLDPANPTTGQRDVAYGEGEACVVDINELIQLEEVMEELNLGPNGAMVYCLEFLEKNSEWLEDQLRGMVEEDPYVYFLFDLPGQVEISSHHESLRNVMLKIRKNLDLRLTAVHLVDAVHCSDASKYIAAVFLSLSTMMRLELPHVNVLSKVDLVESEGTLDFNLDFYTDVMDLDYLLPLLGATPRYLESSEEATARVLADAEEEELTEEAKALKREKLEQEQAEANAYGALAPPEAPKHLFEEKFKRLNGAIVDLIEQYSLVAFKPLNIQDKASVLQLVKHIDKTNEYVNVISPEEAGLLEGGDLVDMSSMAERYMQS
mmetsp:Transcript_5686/g.10637  ORF Transcript_5686/g.10637 Transcript_5686/m.10637 type:complete len:354 (-) Transcript_5686:337-1398(-)